MEGMCLLPCSWGSWAAFASGRPHPSLTWAIAISTLSLELSGSSGSEMRGFLCEKPLYDWSAVCRSLLPSYSLWVGCSHSDSGWTLSTLHTSICPRKCPYVSNSSLSLVPHYPSQLLTDVPPLTNVAHSPSPAEGVTVSCTC